MIFEVLNLWLSENIFEFIDILLTASKMLSGRVSGDFWGLPSKQKMEVPCLELTHQIPYSSCELWAVYTKQQNLSECCVSTLKTHNTWCYEISALDLTRHVLNILVELPGASIRHWHALPTHFWPLQAVEDIITTFRKRKFLFLNWYKRGYFSGMLHFIGHGSNPIFPTANVTVLFF